MKAETGSVFQRLPARSARLGRGAGGEKPAYIYLHYVLDTWFSVRFKKTCRGEARYFRYADEFVACFQYRDDA